MAYSSATTIIVNAEEIRDQLDTILGGSLGPILQEVRDATKIQEASVILGLREQIKENCKLLVPMLVPGQHGTVPDIHVVTLGDEPNVRARVYVSDIFEDDTFCTTDAAPTGPMALSELLKFTQSALHGCFEKNAKISTKPAQVTPQKFAPLTPQHTPQTPLQKSPPTGGHARNTSTDSFWDSDAVTNNSFHATGSFNFGRSDSLNSFESLNSALGGTSTAPTEADMSFASSFCSVASDDTDATIPDEEGTVADEEVCFWESDNKSDTN